VKKLRGHASRVSSALFLPGNDRVLSAAYDHFAKLWNISKYEEVRVLGGRVLKGHHDSVLGATFEDLITPIAPATPAFTADNAPPDNIGALTVADGAYKVEFLAFPFEAYGTAAQKVDLMAKTLDWFGTP